MEMEMEAGDPGSKRRRLVSPGVGEDGGGVDGISNLPDAVLGEIISLIPTKDGARTQILASRWRHLWLSAPLNLDCRGFPAASDDAVSRILSSHPGPCHRFSVASRHLRGDRTAALDVWLRSPCLDSLQELDFFGAQNCDPEEGLVPPPASTFRFSATLLVATIGECHLTDSVAQTLHFPQLKKLALEEVIISQCSLHRLIAGCPALECLLINCSLGFLCVRINSLTLRSLSMKVGFPPDTWFYYGDLVIENAPCLRLLHVDLQCLHLDVVSAPKLETFGCILHGDGHFISNTFVFGSTVIQGLPVDRMTSMVVQTVKILVVHVNTLNLDTFIEFLSCFPCLEKLYIESHGSSRSYRCGPEPPDNFWRCKHRKLVRCFDTRLKIVLLQFYRGTKSEVNFLTFFVFNAKLLELMALTVKDQYYNDKFLALQRRKLQLENRASRGAQFHFTTDRCIHNSLKVEHVRDLDSTDPFAQI